MWYDRTKDTTSLNRLCAMLKICILHQLRPRSDLVPRHGYQSEHSLLLLPEYKFGRGARALVAEVVLGYRVSI